MKSDYKIEILLVFLFLLVTGNFFVWKEIYEWDGKLHVVFFDVGQGDAMFVETPEGHQILIDGGPSGKLLLEKLSKQMPFWDRTIDLIVLTHPEKDHLQGFLSVLKRYKIDNILWTGILRDTKVFAEWLEALKKEKARKIIARAGEKIMAGRLKIFVLYPVQSLEGKRYEDSNDTSIVSRLIFGKNSFLFTGDATKKTEEKILAKKIAINSDVLKVGHHGSKTSSTKDFLRAVSPRIAVISCGRNNSYGHPHSEALSNLAEFGIRVLRTDKHGDIKIFSNGYGLSDF